MKYKFLRFFFVVIFILCSISAGSAFAQKKVPDVKYESGGKGTVVFSHETHMKLPDMKCNSCHTKLFKMKKEMKLTKEGHGEHKYCATCHDGVKTFGLMAEADCAKCHKK